jgi:hypothetical protein
MFSLRLTFLKSPLAKYVIAVAMIIGGLFYVYHKGEEHVQAKWDLEKKQIKNEIDRLNIAAKGVTHDVEVKYIDREKIVIEAGVKVTEYVDRYITPAEDAKCIVPKNFVLLHDSAVRNVVPLGDTP